MKLLITSGGTREHIDAARVIANTSTGHTGRVLAEELASRGCSVLCLRAAGAERPAGVRVRDYVSFSELDGALRAALKKERFDAVIHLAAVSDYSPALIEAGGRKYRPGRAAKLSSSPAELRVTLRRNFKIIDRLKSYAAAGDRPGPFLVGFKLTANASPTQVLAKVRALSAADLVVHNDTAEMKKRRIFHVYRSGRKLSDCAGAERLAKELFNLISLGINRAGNDRTSPAPGRRRGTVVERGHGAGAIRAKP